MGRRSRELGLAHRHPRYQQTKTTTVNKSTLTAEKVEPLGYWCLIICNPIPAQPYYLEVKSIEKNTASHYLYFFGFPPPHDGAVGLMLDCLWIRGVVAGVSHRKS